MCVARLGRRWAVYAGEKVLKTGSWLSCYLYKIGREMHEGSCYF